MSGNVAQALRKFLENQRLPIDVQATLEQIEVRLQNSVVSELRSYAYTDAEFSDYVSEAKTSNEYKNNRERFSEISSYYKAFCKAAGVEYYKDDVKMMLEDLRDGRLRKWRPFLNSLSGDDRLKFDKTLDKYFSSTGFFYPEREFETDEGDTLSPWDKEEFSADSPEDEVSRTQEVEKALDGIFDEFAEHVF